ncbi:MAG: SDR family NAD(P)-dependent oxidoreductase [Candidatus Promineofilum sp.]|nr:SDR family NAD(P)-dependent oxidoreductase [Promineifilum sp.]
MTNQLRFDRRVALITGAGGGLGRAYARLLAARGASVVVNDLGGSMHGEGAGTSAADRVVEEIRAAGGEAVANYDSVEDGPRIVQAALDAFGQLDIVINNAGILRDVSFQKMTADDWDKIYRVHLYGAYQVTRAAWPILRDQGYGRIIMTSSAAGLYGNFGQANYSAAKLGLLGLAQTLAVEGQKRNVLVNAIAPLAGSRMTETILPPELVAALRPEYVAPLVAYLCHESSIETGHTFEVGAGWVARVRWQRGRGAFFPLGDELTPEAIAARWAEIDNFDAPTYPETPTDSFAPVVANLQRSVPSPTGRGLVRGSAAEEQGSGGEKNPLPNPLPRGEGAFFPAPLPPRSPAPQTALGPKDAIGYEFAPVTTTYAEKDVSLYALSVGAAADALDKAELPFVYELSGDGFRPLPTFAVTFPFALLWQITAVPGLRFNPALLLHGEQYLELRRPLPTKATLTHRARIADIYDKGSAALVLLDVHSYDEADREVAFNRSSLFIRGLGGFGGERGPSGGGLALPDRAPDATHQQATTDNQALLYRLSSGDGNPLHADPAFAAAGGFPRPILHGLCSFGFAGRAVLRAFAGNDPARFKSIKARFARHVFPGETIVTDIWADDADAGRILFQSKVAERDEVVLSNGVVELSR